MRIRTLNRSERQLIPADKYDHMMLQYLGHATNVGSLEKEEAELASQKADRERQHKDFGHSATREVWNDLAVQQAQAKVGVMQALAAGDKRGAKRSGKEYQQVRQAQAVFSTWALEQAAVTGGPLAKSPDTIAAMTPHERAELATSTLTRQDEGWEVPYPDTLPAGVQTDGLRDLQPNEIANGVLHLGEADATNLGDRRGGKVAYFNAASASTMAIPNREATQAAYRVLGMLREEMSQQHTPTQAA